MAGLDTFDGKTIKSASCPSDTLLLSFTDGTTGKVYDAGQWCCEHRYMVCDDDLSQFAGATVTGIECLPYTGDWGGDDFNVHEAMFVHVNTNMGSIVLETHNVHNGYYGGFWVKATLSEQG